MKTWVVAISAVALAFSASAASAAEAFDQTKACQRIEADFAAAMRESRDPVNWHFSRKILHLAQAKLALELWKQFDCANVTGVAGLWNGYAGKPVN